MRDNKSCCSQETLPTIFKLNPKFKAKDFSCSFGEEVSDDEIQDRIRNWDGDGDGKINFAEFLIAMAAILTDTDNEERMREAFRIFDKVRAGGLAKPNLTKPNLITLFRAMFSMPYTSGRLPVNQSYIHK